MFWNFCVGIHACTVLRRPMTSCNLTSQGSETRKFVMDNVLHWKQGLLFSKALFEFLSFESSIQLM